MVPSTMRLARSHSMVKRGAQALGVRPTTQPLTAASPALGGSFPSESRRSSSVVAPVTTAAVGRPQQQGGVRGYGAMGPRGVSVATSALGKGVDRLLKLQPVRRASSAGAGAGETLVAGKKTKFVRTADGQSEDAHALRRSNAKRRRTATTARVFQEEGLYLGTEPLVNANVGEDLLRQLSGEGGKSGKGAHPVLELLRHRFRTKRKDDGFKLGLVVEGGGMRGVTSAGMLVELHNLGMDGLFDSVYGSSAGAINLTYFLSKDPTGADIYTNHIANSDFISLSRLLGGGKSGKKPVLDVGYLLDHVMEDVLPLEWDKVVNAETPLKVAASSLDNGGSPVLLENFRDKHDLKECLRASANVPGIAGEPVHHRGHRLVDAMVYEPVPVWSAIDDGCTHILTLSTKPRHEGRNVAKRLQTSLIKRFFMSPKYLDRKLYREAEASDRGTRLTERMLCVEDLEESRKLFGGANVYTLFPESQPIGSLCKKKEKIQKARNYGHQAIQDLFLQIISNNNNNAEEEDRAKVLERSPM